MEAAQKRQIEQLVASMEYEELRALNRQVVDRLRLIQRAREMAAFREFRMLDRVFFHDAGEHIVGTVVRINQRTVSVHADDGRRWTIPPALLQKVPEDSEDARPAEAAVRHWVKAEVVTPAPPKAPGKSHPTKKASSKRKKRRR